MNQRLPRRTAPVLFIVFLAAALQFWGLDAQSLWYDEGFSAWLSQKPIHEIIAFTAADIHPPFYYLLLHFWVALAGNSEWALRFLSAIFAVLSVPLMWQLACRLLRQAAAAHVVALLVALSPLMLWYGRDARMYSLALVLLMLAALLLLRLLARASRVGEGWGGALCFGLLAAAALYTHFYAWFVLAAYGLVALWCWLRRPRRARLGPLLLAFALPFLAFLPWLKITLHRLGADRSYWEGQLRPLEVIEEMLASWMVGHTIHEAQAVPLGWLGGVLALVGALLFVWRAARCSRPDWTLKRPIGPATPPFHHWLLVMLWLLLPLVGLLVISWHRPKFHPRYLIFAAPAFFLLLGALVGWFWARRWAGRLVALSLTALLLTIFLYADRELFTNPAFAKADWRGVAAYLAENRRPEEPVLLISGHTYPVFHYYYPVRENLFYLPEEATLDTTRVLGLETGRKLARSLADAPSVWVVEWQEEVVDPEQMVPTLLRAAGGRRDVVPGFMEVQLSRWFLPASASLEEALTPSHPLSVNFGNALQLLGWDGMPAPLPADEGVGLLLYWAAGRPLEEDFKVHMSVVDEQGFEYGSLDQRPTSYNFPTFRWQPGDLRVASIQIPLEPGTPPGDYWVTISVYSEASGSNLDLLDEAGAPQGQEVRVGPISVAPSTFGWLGMGPPDSTLRLSESLLDDQQLLAARLALPAELEPGQQVPLTLWWRTAGPLPGARLHLGWERGSLLMESESRPPGGPGWPGELWRPGDLLMTPLTIRVPREIQPGRTRLVAWLSDGAGRSSRRVTLASGDVVAGQRSFSPPEVEAPQKARFGEKILLLGYDLSSPELQVGEPLTLTVYWEALDEMEKNLTAFAHLLDADGTIVPGGGQDKLPLDGARLTNSWLPGEYLTDTFTLLLPDEAEPGPYRIEIGWYDANEPDLPRLPATGEGADRNRVLIDHEFP